MSRKALMIEKIKPLLNNRIKLEEFLVKNSNLPGKRANIELAFALAEVYEEKEVVLDWTKISEDEAGVNKPRSFLAFCGTVCLGAIYAKSKERRLVDRLRKMASDGRWRIREAVAFGLQKIGEKDFEELKKIIVEWMKGEINNLELRAVLVALAHLEILDKQKTKFCFKLTEKILMSLKKDKNFDVLNKGLGFVISVYVEVNPEDGFRVMKKWIKKDKDIDLIIKNNLKKNRLVKKFPRKVIALLKVID